MNAEEAERPTIERGEGSLLIADVEALSTVNCAGVMGMSGWG